MEEEGLYFLSKNQFFLSFQIGARDDVTSVQLNHELFNDWNLNVGNILGTLAIVYS